MRDQVATLVRVLRTQADEVQRGVAQAHDADERTAGRTIAGALRAVANVIAEMEKGGEDARAADRKKYDDEMRRG